MYCIQQSPSRCVSLSANGVQKCDGWNPNSCRSLVLSHSQDEVSAGPSNLSSLEVTAFDFLYCSPCFLQFVSVPTYCFMCNGDVVRFKGTYDSFRGASKVKNSPCRKDILELFAVYVHPCNQMQKQALVYSCMV